MQRHKIHKQKGETKMSWTNILTMNKKDLKKKLLWVKKQS